MAKHVILESYTFSPSTRTVVVNGKNIRREHLLLITNVTRNTVIYNFSDPNLTATSYTNSTSQAGSFGGSLETTTILLNYNTTAMSSSDKLSILVEETYQEITPAETMLDPVGKMRVSEPQSLIDTDFEYGTQTTKWESITLTDNRPSAFIGGGRFGTGVLTISNITGSYQSNTSVMVTISDTWTPNIVAGDPIFVQGTLDPANADGWFTVETVNANVSFTYRTTGVPQWALYDATKTYVNIADWYSNAAIAVNNVIVNSNVITVSTTNAHGLQPGNGIWLDYTTGVPMLDGPWTVATTPTSNTFTANGYNFTGAGPLTITNGAFPANILYTRPTSYVQHRPYDGGVQFSNQNPSPGSQVIRQTRRYFRYQSGKGVQFSTGSILKPALSVETLTAVGSTITVNCRQTHGMGIGANIVVSGSLESAYNGTYTVTGTPSQTQLTYTAASSPVTSPAPGLPINVSPTSWYGSKTRIGMFDSQNGFFFEFDGQSMWCVKRFSTQQISGSVTVASGSPVVTGLGTRFASQLLTGDFIVIRGMSYLIQSIISDTQLVIAPEYRGTSATRCLVSKTIDIKIPQSSWNIDTCDGNGASLFNLDLTKMQMFYIDYSWYGAGAIRFGFKNNRGEVIYCHRITNNNVNTEAYMRSGNMCARYETNTLAPYTVLTSTLSSGTSTGGTVTVQDATGFPPTGTLQVVASGNQNAPIEYISYSAKSGNVFTILSRAVFGGVASANTFTVTGAGTYTPGGTAPVQVTSYSPQNASTVSHWGSSVIMDGKYDDDKSLVFNIGQNDPIRNLPENQRYALISLRIAPSVDNSLTGLLGAKELVNRMQLVLRQMDALTTSPFRVDVILNGTPGSGFWVPVGGSSLAQYSLHANATPIFGGENIFSFFTQNSGQSQQEMTIVRDLGTSILGGGSSNLANTFLNKYPDGPDMITICATSLQRQATANINARISWTEAQA
jgi:hypothetical protein